MKDYWKPTDGAIIRLLPPLNSTPDPHYRHRAGPVQRHMCMICDFEKERQKMSKLKLEPSLIPQSAWGQSLSNLHKKDRCKYWPSIRDDAIMKHGSQCVYCPATPSHGHEIWRYDDTNAVMTLLDVVPVCEWCHHCIHLGHAELLAAKGELDFKAVLQHFATVRECKLREIEAIGREAFDLWEVRSQRQWTVDFGKFKVFIHEPGKLPPVSVFDDMEVKTDGERIPSETKHVKWLSVRTRPELLSDGAKTGHFLLSGVHAEIDRIWPTLARMTLAGELGSEAYASTAGQWETAGLLSKTALAGVVLGPDDDREEIERMLNKVFGNKVASIRYKRPG